MFFFKFPKSKRKPEAYEISVDFDGDKFSRLLDDALSKSMSVGCKTFAFLHGKREPHIVAEAMCWKCGHRWIATFPESTLLKQLQCPHCEEQGFAFLTNQDVDAINREE